MTTVFLRIFLIAVFVLSITTPQKAAAASIKKKDHGGQMVELSETPERLATVWPVITSIILALDNGPDRLVAIPKQSKKTLMKGIMAEIYPSLKKVSAKAINNKRVPNIEELLQLNPDIVFQDYKRAKSVDAMRAAGLTVFGLKQKKKGIAKLLLMDVGVMTGREDRARELVANIDKAFTEIKAKTANIEDAKKPSIIYLWHKSQILGPSHHVNEVLQAAGAKNAAKHSKNFIGYDSEMLLEIDPDIIFLHHLTAKKVPNDFYNDPIYADMKAVKNKRIYKVPIGGAAGWDGPSQERGLALEWFTRVVQGNDFLDGSLRANIKNIFPKLYGKSVSDKQIDRMLSVGLNSGSPDYEKIAK